MNFTEIPELVKLVNEKNQELLPCPFCGDVAEIDNTWTDHYHATCTGCGADVPARNESKDPHSIDAHRSSILIVAEAWNQRFRF